ncbi:MAG: glycoside hydrolase family 31 protein [Butyrivibrio sp.]|nr:glycoside hydrolase family 31 protein [Butyrivibrio sp.]
MNSIISSGKYRISILTDRLIRLEYNEDGRFEDRMTRAVVNRTPDDVSVSVTTSNGRLVVQTKELVLNYDEKEFTTQGLSIEMKSTGKVWHYSVVFGNSDRNLFGTARTLDEKDGSTPLEPGIFGRNGYAVLDDSGSPVFEESEDGEGRYVLRDTEAKDLYFFGYGTDFYGGLRDFYRLCGKTPLIPRYSLGNWWSRYYRYSEESYKEVVDKFREEEIPLSVAVIDMDWHVTDVDSKYGTGWTGYTWNKELFPDYKRFLKMLHDNGLSVTLNLHPADGVRAFEDMYRQVAEKAGIDPDSEETVEFDFGNESFRKAYFEEIMHPYEADGVDFWWIDWQQGTGRKASDVDPLFLLNHYHYRDQEMRNVRPMIFSRYAGPGSHRYPVGFSGDTVCSWKSLCFQPYFTSTASNIGYGWWSHDIGGHMLGDKDNERLIRWIQLGVFSPIMRLHSSNSPFLNKEPWTIEEPYHSVMQKFMRLRHRLVPYIYTESYRAHHDDRPLIRPMYYDNPENEAAYDVPCEYGFGDMLIVGAVTEKMDEELRMASVNMLIPKGRYVDIFNGRVYQGPVRRKLYRDIESVPVLLKAGGILPLADNNTKNTTANPDSMEILIAAGESGSYSLYEDDGCSMNYRNGAFVTTEIVSECSSECITVSIKPSSGDLSLIPGSRDIKLTILGVSAFGELPEVSDEEGKRLDTSYDAARHSVTVRLGKVSAQKGAAVKIRSLALSENDLRTEVYTILDRAWTKITDKDIVYRALNGKSKEEFLEWLRGSGISETLKDAITEVYED